MRLLSNAEKLAAEALTDEWLTPAEIGATAFVLWNLCSPDVGLAQGKSIVHRNEQGIMIAEDLYFRKLEKNSPA